MAKPKVDGQRFLHLVMDPLLDCSESLDLSQIVVRFSPVPPLA